MIAKTQEGLIGASKAMNTIRTPMKVFKEARARGDKATMDRAMGYVSEIHDDAWKHKYNTDQALKQEAEENKYKEEEAREDLAQRIEENKDKLEERVEEGKSEGLQTVTQTKTEGSVEDSDEQSNAVNDSAQSSEKFEAAKTNSNTTPVTYDGSGNVIKAEVEVKFNVTV